VLMFFVNPRIATRSGPERVMETGSWSLNRLVLRCSVNLQQCYRECASQVNRPCFQTFIERTGLVCPAVRDWKSKRPATRPGVDFNGLRINRAVAAKRYVVISGMLSGDRINPKTETSRPRDVRRRGSESSVVRRLLRRSACT